MQAYRSGAISATARPLIHRSSQNRARWPLPTVVVVDAKKNARSSRENCKSRPLQALPSSTWLSQSQRVRRESGALKVVDAKAAKGNRPTNAPPIHMAVAPIGLGAACP